MRDQPGVHLTHAPEHLLRNPAIVRVALRRGAELAEVVDLAQRGPEVPANAEGQWDRVLGQLRTDRAREERVRLLCPLERFFEGRGESERLQAGRHVEAERRPQKLA